MNESSVRLIGKQLGNYRLLRLLGQGGFAEVYLGEHIYLKTYAALKILHTVLEGEEHEGFIKEAQTLARLIHPHIVRVLDFAVEQGAAFLVMEYAPHGTLRQRHPKETHLTLATIVSYTMQIASALQYAHDQGYIHSDVKPENMLLAAQGRVLLSDFGLATLLARTSSTSTQAAEQPLVGTASYIAPEQLRTQPVPSSDQYALGAVIYEWLCGVPPFRGSFLQIATQHLTMPPPALRVQLPTLSPAIETVVLKALAKKPEDRFSRVQDFADALAEAAGAQALASTDHAHQSASGYVALPIVLAEAQTQERATAPARITDPLIQPQHAHELQTEPLWTVPLALTPLLGREQDTQTAAALLRREEVRLLTLTGPGGTGKTRLAMQVATELRHAFANGVCFVPLASVSDPALVATTIAHALGIRESKDYSARIHLLNYLRSKHLLLVLDNFEQITTATGLAEILEYCEAVKILVTSRTMLRLQGEYRFVVPPLLLPDLDDLSEDDPLTHYASTALFIQHAQAVKHDFRVTPTNARAIAEICVRLDGLPLAIELAAARVSLLSPQALLIRLGQRLQLLTGGARNGPERHQTLRNTIQWSYDLLQTPEQKLFRRLAVFAGGCTLAALEAICSALDGTALQVFDGITALIDHSLLQQVEQEGEPRVRMLETLREYGLEMLAANGEMEETRKAHASYYLDMAEEGEQAFGTAEHTAWLRRLTHEHDNLRAALRWSLERNEQEMALRFGGALREFWTGTDQQREGWHFLQHILKQNEECSSPARAKALFAAADLAINRGEYTQAEALARKSQALYLALDDGRGQALCLHVLQVIARTRGDYIQARALAEEAWALFKKLGDQENAAWSHFRLARLAALQGEFARACALFEENVALHQQSGNKEGMVYASLYWTDTLALSQGDPLQVQALLAQSRALLQEWSNKDSQSFLLYISARIALGRGEIPTAGAMAEQQATLAREMEDQESLAEAQFVQGKVALARRDATTAHTLLAESLASFRAMGNTVQCALCLEGLAEVAVAQEKLAWAARLLGNAEALRERVGSPLPPANRSAYAQTQAAIKARLDTERLRMAWQEGRAMTLEQVLAAQESIAHTALKTVPASAGTRQKPASASVALSEREAEVLRLLAQGMTNVRIADQLVISPFTVNAHVRSIFNKLDVSSRSAATRYAIEHHLL